MLKKTKIFWRHWFSSFYKIIFADFQDQGEKVINGEKVSI